MSNPRRIRHFVIVRSRQHVALWLWGAILALRSLAVELGNLDLIAAANIAAALASAWLTFLLAISMVKTERETVSESELVALGRGAQHHDPATCARRLEDQ